MRYQPAPTALSLALVACFPALAQTPPEDPATLQEVVVTAQKRATLASRTPASLAVITGDDLKAEGAADTKRLAELMPNVQLGNGAAGAVEVSMRGIGSTNNSEVGDPAVSVSIDGVVLGRPQMAGAALFDIERVEVLRGPQGTLYGRNSTAGAINIITRKPTKSFEGEIGFGLSNRKGIQADAMFNVPVNQTLALRGVVSGSKRDGYIDSAHSRNKFTDDHNDVDNTSARVHGLLDFGAGRSLLVSADYSHDGGTGPGAVDPNRVAANSTGSEGRTILNSRYEGRNRIDSNGLSAEYKQGLSFADLTMQAAHRTQKRELIYSIADGPAGGAYYSYQEQDTLEARLASQGNGALEWVGGVFLFREKGSPIVLQSFSGTGNLFYQDPMIAKSAAVFGQATYAVRADTRLTGGLRYTRDTKSRQGCTYPFAALTGLPELTNPDRPIEGNIDGSRLPACTGASVNNVPSVRWTQTTFRLGVDHNLNPETLVYATYSTGFKAGGFNNGDLTTALNPAAIIYKPELLKAFEMGLKGRYLQRTLQVNASLFAYDFADLQLSAIAPDRNNNLSALTTNAGQARVYGFELEGRYLMTARDRVNFGLGVADAKYKRFITAANQDWAGLDLDKAPHATANLGYSHAFTLASGATLTASVGERWSSSYYLSNSRDYRYRQKQYHKTDAHLTYASADDRWNVQAYVRNIEDRNVATTYQFGGGAHGLYLAEPRSYGLRATMMF
jgi:iron complex outermembrane receptor protein